MKKENLEKREENKKIEFSKGENDAISGYALSFTFIIVSVFLLRNLHYFGNKIASIIILALFSIVGIAGAFVELDKNKFIKGVGDLGVGIIFFGPWMIVYHFADKWWLNIITFILLVVGTYGIISGVIKIAYSIFNSTKGANQKVKTGIVNFLKILPAIASFILVIFNIIKIINELE